MANQLNRQTANSRTRRKTTLHKRKRLKYIAVLPTAVTLVNALCGFLSIVYASRGPLFFRVSGYLIVLAMIADIFDGQVARWSGSASGFGGQLDSLSDVLSFGAAPAFLMFKVMEFHLGLEASTRKFFFPASLWKAFPQDSPQLAQLAGRWVLFTAIFYVLCAIIRLARFNVENDTDVSAHQNFAGLPSPAAAGVVVSLVIFQEDFLVHLGSRLPEFSTTLIDITRWILPLAVLASGILMVTRIRYSHLANKLLRGKKNFVTVLLVLFAVFLAVWNIELALILGFWGFAAAGVIRELFGRVFRKHI
ncbi:phosphatidylserine synthase [Spirochaetia bacterium]|nr:phosphatidylserine synthase [Spirochaetia bacterium]